MPKAAPKTIARRRHPWLAVVAAASLIAAAPGVTHPGPAPGPALAGHDELRDLLADIARGDAQPAPSLEELPDGHALRAAVTPHNVRLTVDPDATHPLSGPVAVRREAPLGNPARRLRLVSLGPPDPAPQPAPQAVATSAPAAKPPRPAPAAPMVAVKNPSPTGEAAPASPPPAKSAVLSGRSILVAGDSLSIYLAEALRPLTASRPDTAFASRSKISSGLARPSFFDWEREMAALAEKHRPDTVIVIIATNDNQTMTRPDGKKVAFGRPGWDAEYARRVRRLVELARLGNPQARIHWIGAPVMADPRLNADVAAINGVIARQIDALSGCRFVDVSRTLADAAGRYAASLTVAGGPRTVRAKDGVHLTPFGAKLLAHAAMASLHPAVAELGRPRAALYPPPGAW